MKSFFIFLIFVSSLVFFLLSFLCFRLLRSSGSSPDASSQDSDSDPTDLRSRWRNNENISDFPYSHDDGGSDPAPQGFSLSVRFVGVMCFTFFLFGIGLFNAAVWFMNH